MDSGQKFWPRSGKAIFLLLRSGRVRATSGSGKILQKFPNFSTFSPPDQKNLINQKILGSRTGWPLIFCRSEVSLGQGGAGHSPSLPYSLLLFVSVFIIAVISRGRWPSDHGIRLEIRDLGVRILAPPGSLWPPVLWTTISSLSVPFMKKVEICTLKDKKQFLYTFLKAGKGLESVLAVYVPTFFCLLPSNTFEVKGF